MSSRALTLQAGIFNGLESQVNSEISIGFVYILVELDAKSKYLWKIL